MKHYWRIDRVKNITPSYLIESIRFLENNDGQAYTVLDTAADSFYSKPSDSGYFGRIITSFNLLGLVIKNLDGTYNISELCKLISSNPDLAAPFLDYFLVKFQFPRPHFNDNNPITKPYFLLLKILIEISKVDPKAAFLTEKEFYYLFNESVPIRLLSSIDAVLISQILYNNRSWGVSQNAIPQPGNDLSYDNSFFNNSTVLTKDHSLFSANSASFFIGLHPDKVAFANFLLAQYSFSVYNYTLGDDLAKIGWSAYVHNIPEFIKFLNYRNMLTKISPFVAFCLSEGYYFSDDLIRRFILSLSAKPYLLLTGISGTGKSKIAELFGKFIVADSSGKFLFKAVGSNWNDNKNLLGYVNPLIGDGKYFKTDVVDFITEANVNPDKTYLLLLDEMNLSYTERYFSDFLAALESLSREITLPDGNKIRWPLNLKIVGTINEDETTHTLSPKVIDRANIIEMNGSSPKDYLEKLISKKDVKLQSLSLQAWFEDYKALLDEIYTAVNCSFGYRAIDEINCYVELNAALSGKDFLPFLDEQVCQKILPKINGSKGSVHDKLEKLSALVDIKAMPVSKAKIDIMKTQLRNTGFVNFISQ